MVYTHPTLVIPTGRTLLWFLAWVGENSLFVWVKVADPGGDNPVTDPPPEKKTGSDACKIRSWVRQREIRQN